MENNRNFFITIALSVLILTLWQVFYMNPQDRGRARGGPHRSRAARQQSRRRPTAGTARRCRRHAGAAAGAACPALPGGDAADAADPRGRRSPPRQRVKIDTPSLVGLDQPDRRAHRRHQAEGLPRDRRRRTRPTIELLNPAGLPNGYFAEIGFVGSDDAGTVPGAGHGLDRRGQPDADAGDARHARPITNDKGLTFKRTISVDEDYMFTVSDTVTNAGAAPVSLSNYGRVTRFDKPTTASIYVLHEGLIGVTGEEGLQEIDYSHDRGRQAGQARQVDRRLARHHRQILGGGAGAVRASSRSSRASPISTTAARATRPTF